MILPQIIGYGSITVDPANNKGSAKKELLCQIFARFLPVHTRDTCAFHLLTDDNGRPYLQGKYAGNIQISFSYCENRLWAVMANGAPVGIDAAAPAEFADGYPFNRIFTRRELRLLGRLQGDVPSSAAILWACKEAVVKARGSGFHTISPLDVEINRYMPTSKGFRVELTADRSYTAVVQGEDHLWLAIAGMNNTTEHNEQHVTCNSQ